MYTVFGATPTLRLCLAVYGLAILAAGTFLQLPNSVLAAIRWALTSSGLFMALTFGLAGLSWFYSPWRILFRLCRKLNQWIFPDLNGVWYGKTQSNWGVIETKRVAASTDGGLDLGDLPSVPLKEGEIALEIKADLFRIRVRSKVGDTGGTSTSLSSRAEKTSEEYRLSYLYRQETPEPSSTDESAHDGAATLLVNLSEEMRMQGVYWTRRKWREGMNTAGMIAIKQVSSLHAPRGADLLEHARQLSRQS